MFHKKKQTNTQFYDLNSRTFITRPSEDSLQAGRAGLIDRWRINVVSAKATNGNSIRGGIICARWRPTVCLLDVPLQSLHSVSAIFILVTKPMQPVCLNLTLFLKVIRSLLHCIQSKWQSKLPINSIAYSARCIPFKHRQVDWSFFLNRPN